MNYDWGNPSPSGVIARLLGPEKEPGNKPLAELWMGAHPKAPALLAGEKVALEKAISDNPLHFLGPKLTQAGLNRLPFLFKVLDASRPLSIQAHPDLKLAARLHRRDPQNYPDANHKPELAIALDRFSALIGFRPLAEINAFFLEIPELSRLCGNWEGKNPLADTFARLMRSTSSAVEEVVVPRLKRLKESSSGAKLDQLFIKLTDEFGVSDPGLFCIYFLNVVEVERGGGLFLPANEPHAYLHGSILECMAASDNVVRAGLTSKFRDVDTLLSMLSYRAAPWPILQPRSINPTLSCYDTPCDEFLLLNQKLEAGESQPLTSTNRPQIAIVMEGSVELKSNHDPAGGHHFESGDIIFFPGDLEERNISPNLSTKNSNSGCEIYIATTPAPNS